MYMMNLKRIMFSKHPASYIFFKILFLVYVYGSFACIYIYILCAHGQYWLLGNWSYKWL